MTRPQLAEAWGPALLGGVELASGVRGLLTLNDLDFVAYGDVFRPASRLLDGGVPSLTAEDVNPGLETDLLMAWWRAAGESDPQVVSPDERALGTLAAPSDSGPQRAGGSDPQAAGSSDPQVASLGERGFDALATVRAAILALAGSKFLAQVSERILVFWLKQVSTYFTNADVRAEIQRRFAAAIGADTRVVVAHSLGSVVAYEGLCAHPQWPVTDLVTLGSPLGVPHIVTQRLQPPPVDDGRGRLVGAWPGVERWVNITDDHDFAALQPRLRPLFGDRVTDVAISNGVEAHDPQRYLSAVETGAAILAGLRG